MSLAIGLDSGQAVIVGTNCFKLKILWLSSQAYIFITGLLYNVCFSIRL